ncbi:flagellar motor switch protein FliN [Thermovibrio sp.]
MAEEEKSQEELAKEWEEALKEQEKESSSEEDVMAAWQEALKEQESSSTEGKKEGDSCEGKFELLKDIPLEVMVEIGSTKLPLEEILNLHANSVIELDRLIDEPVDIKINGKLVAKGKLYVVEDSYGVEITQIITPEERLKLIEEE